MLIYINMQTVIGKQLNTYVGKHDLLIIFDEPINIKVIINIYNRINV